MPRIYLDNAATSWPKPETVYQAVDRYQRTIGAAAGRGGYREAEQAHRLLSQLRHAAAQQIGAESTAEIIITQNCTDSLNLALHGLLLEGDHVLSSDADHNSVLRPLHHLAGRDVQVRQIPVDPLGIMDVSALESALKQQAVRLLVVNHVSNVTGARQPIEEIARLAKEHGALVLLDAAQSLGHEPIDVRELKIDMLAAPGHKGLLGPLGTGLLYVNLRLHPKLRSIRQGGTGTESEIAAQPEAAPFKYESGNLNMPGIAGLEAGLQFVRNEQLEQSNHLLDLSSRLVRALQDERTIAVHSSPNRFGIVSFNLADTPPTDLAMMLDTMANIQVRAGFHCAPAMHRAMGTDSCGGSVRVSFGHFSNASEVDTLVGVLQTVVANPMV